LSPHSLDLRPLILALDNTMLMLTDRILAHSFTSWNIHGYRLAVFVSSRQSDWLFHACVSSAGDCPPGSLPCENGRCFTPGQSCDFTDDCGDGTDEKDCGTSCSFENGRCGWLSSPADNFDWTLGTGSVKSIQPPYDHTLMDESGTCSQFAYTPKPSTGVKVVKILGALASSQDFQRVIETHLHFWVLYNRSSWNGAGF